MGTEEEVTSIRTRPRYTNLTDIRKDGRRVQDKNNLRRQLEVERERTSKLRRTQLTADAVKEKASNTELSNDRIMRLGEERLQVRIKMKEMSVLQWWKDIKEPEGVPYYRHTMRLAWKSFPYWHRIMYKAPDGKPARTKTQVQKDIGLYLKRAKYMAKTICDFAYGVKGTDKAVPKRDRLVEEGDILEQLKLFRVVDNIGIDDFVEPAALRVFSSMTKLDPHYTYTAAQPITPTDGNNADVVTIDDEDDEDGNDFEEGDEIEVALVSIT